jgi:hypothetical protein
VGQPLRIKLHPGQQIVTLNNVKRWRYIVLAGAVLLGIVYVYLYRQELGLVGPHGFGATSGSGAYQEAEVRPARINWQTVNRPNNGFKVEMPADPKDIQVPAYNESGASEPVNMLFSTPDGGTSFAVAWADNPPVARVNRRSPGQVLTAARDGALERTQTSLTNETSSSPGGVPARDLVAHNAGGGVMDSRLLYSGDRLYMLIAVFPSRGARREQDVARFFNSFTVLGASSVPTTLPLATQPQGN